jgi:serine/threonine protein kinase
MADEHLISLQPGTVIAGRYEVVKCLGAGSMGLVYACRHRELTGLKVAMKVLFPEVTQDKTAMARFRQEVMVGYDVAHPNVVRPYEYFRDGDLVAFTMEFVDGGDLASRLEGPEPMPVEQIVNVLAQMAAGVQALHDKGIVHRDLKPENILLSKDGVVKIADFGIARTGYGPKLTEHGGVVGTIDYVAPEYMLHSQFDSRSDIYALGILGYEMLTGDSPFRGDSVYATMTKRLKTDPKPPSELRPDCPPELDKIVLRAMARDPEQRYQSAAELLQELQQWMPDASSGPELLVARPRSSAGRGPEVAPLPMPPAPDVAAPPLFDDAPFPATPSSFSAAAANGGQVEKPSADPERGQVRPVLSPVEEPIDYPRPTATAARRMPPKPKPVSMGEIGRGAPEHRQNDQLGTIAPGPYTPYGSANSAEDARFGEAYLHDETIVEPVRMERAISGVSPRAGVVARPDPPQAREVQLRGSAIDDQKFRRLQQLADGERQGSWFNILVYLAAVVIGVGVGLAVMKLVGGARRAPEAAVAPRNVEVTAGPARDATDRKRLLADELR